MRWEQVWPEWEEGCRLMGKGRRGMTTSKKRQCGFRHFLVFMAVSGLLDIMGTESCSQGSCHLMRNDPMAC